MKLVTLFISISFLAACGAGTGETSKSDSAIGLQPIVNNGGTNIDTANVAGDRLIAANDCLTCHQIEQKSIGPSYQQIANHYEMNEGNIENLAHKIINGGKGLWGQVAMTPHPNVTYEQARSMSSYILSLRNTNSNNDSTANNNNDSNNNTK